MNLDSIQSNKIYALVDCDSFFASCEVLRCPSLQGKPVCVGGDIIVAATYEAKKQGIKTGTPIWEAKKILGQAGIFIRPDLGFYQKVSSRLMKFLKDYSNNIEIFSVDEAFIDITGINEFYKKSYDEFIEFLKIEIKKNIGIPVSIGASKTRILSKMFTKINKPFGTFCAIENNEINKALDKIKVGDIPFIGKNSEKKIATYSQTALEYKNLEHTVIKNILKGGGFKIWLELNGVNIFNFNNDKLPKGISRTRSFNPNFTSDKSKLFEYLVYNFERAYKQLIDLDMKVKRLSIFLRKKDFIQNFCEYSFVNGINNRKILLITVDNLFNKTYAKGFLYRGTGIIFSEIECSNDEQTNLFNYQQDKKSKNLSLVVNRINDKFGRFIIVSGSSMKSKSNKLNVKGLIGNVV